MPLSRSAPMKRTRMKATRPKPAVPKEVRELLWARAQGVCEAQLPGCTYEATDACHRIARKAGGRPNGDDARLSNLWAGCRVCHRWATDRPAEAYDLGLMLRDWQDPFREPMAYQNAGFVLLDDEGFLMPVGDAA